MAPETRLLIPTAMATLLALSACGSTINASSPTRATQHTTVLATTDEANPEPRLASAGCDQMRFDLRSGTFNELTADLSQEQVKKALPCFTGATEDGGKYNYGGGVFFTKHDLYFYTGNDFIEVRRAFRGKVEPPLLGQPLSAVAKHFGEGRLQKDRQRDWLYETGYGCLRVEASDGFVVEVAAHLGSCDDVEAWYDNY